MKTIVAVGLFALAACGPRKVHEEPIMVNGDRIASADAAVATAGSQAQASRTAMVSRRDSLAAAALGSCSGPVCGALARGELSIGMTETQVMAATKTTPDAWSTRRAGSGTVMVAFAADMAPRDVNGEVAMVQLADGRVRSVSYREAHGLRVVDGPADVTVEGRAQATSEALLREGDALAAAGDRAGALDRYDRASVLRPRDAILQYRIATLLDQQLRPIEAHVRYLRFLHQLELEKIEATGEANAKLAQAIAHAKERIIVLEKHSR